MGYDVNTKTIIVENDDDAIGTKFQGDSAVHWVSVYTSIYKNEDKPPPIKIKKDTEILFNWLGQEIGVLNKSSIDKLKSAWIAYLSIGFPPTDALQESFDLYSKSPGAEQRSKNRPPQEIMDVFDRMLASEEDIKERRDRVFGEEKRKIEAVFKKFKKKKTLLEELKDTYDEMSDKKRIFWKLTIAWIFWVLVRSNNSFELVGYYFNKWDDGMFIQNVLVVPVLLYVGHYVYKYLKKN